MKEKRNGINKGRTCSNGSKKKRYLKEGFSMSSLTVSLEFLFATLMTDGYKGR